MDWSALKLDDLRRVVKYLTGRGIKIRFVRESLTFTGEDSPMTNLLFSAIGSLAEFKRALINERQKEDMPLAKAQSKYKGRPRSMTETK
jgi:DNA invertase Pin-like site-specific DNA recombinase